MTFAQDATPSSVMIPIFPLPVVLFPGMKLPLVVFEAPYIEMIQEITASGSAMGVTLYLETAVENVAVATSVGTLARVVAVDSQTEGRLALLVEGLRRFKIVRIDSESKPYLQAEVAPYDDDDSHPVPAVLREELVSAFRQMLALYAQTQQEERPADPDVSASDAAQTLDAPSDEEALPMVADFDALPLSQAFEDTLETLMADLVDVETLDFEGVSDADLTFRVGEFLNHDETIQQKLLEMRACHERMQEEKTHLEALTRRLALMRQINAVFDKPSPEA